MNFLPLFQYTQSELKNIANNFTTELQKSETQTTSLAYLKNHLSSKSFIGAEESILAIVIGGTNYSIAYIESGIELGKFNEETGQVPQLADSSEFVDFIMKHLPKGCNKIAINFAYPLEPTLRDDRLDGILLRVAKKDNLVDLIGLPVGLTLEKAIWDKFQRRVNITLANDIVCLLLQSKLNHEINDYDVAGGIIGTGSNLGLFKDQNTIVNLESGNFNVFEATPTGLLVDRNSPFPGRQKLGKEIEGRFLYQHYNLIADQMSWSHLQNTQQLNQISQGNDLQSEVARGLLDRTAGLIAAQMGGIYDYLKADRLILVMEGSIFWNAFGFPQSVRIHLQNLGYPSSHQIEFIKAKSSIFGAIALGIFQA